MTILKAFLKFTDEAALIGRMLAGYADLEVNLMHCTQVVRDDLDTVLKVMFRTRGETQRIDVAVALGRQHYRDLDLGTQYEMAVGAVRYCLRIRNQYAHCIWWDDNSGQLAFANLEEVAKENERLVNLKGLTVHYVDIPLLQSQLAYFEYADSLLKWTNWEGRARAGKQTIPNRIAPVQIEQPSLYIRKG